MTNEPDISLKRIDSPEADTPPAPLALEALPAALGEACARAGWTELMPVQARSMPYMLGRRDIMVQSRTGSGKTGAYLLPMLANLNQGLAKLQALVLVPTRELALQVEHEAKRLLEPAGLSVAAIYGGVGYERQIAALKAGVSLVVGTPGRILDHLLRRSMILDDLTELVFDEADRMLSIGFYPDMKEIQRYLPKRGLHSTLFSATYPSHVLRLADEFLDDPDLLSLSGEQVHVAEVEHAFCECKTMEKDRVLMRLIQVENPAGAIVFCNTKANVHYVTSILQSFGICADELSADLTQGKREAVLDRLRNGRVKILVATDVAARGIDIPALSHVFLYEPPEDREAYIHRAGRTGRAGAAGMVVSLVDVMQRLELDRIAQFYRIPLVQLPPPGEDDVAEAVGRRVQAVLESRYRELSPIAKERLTQLIPLVQRMAGGEEDPALLAMVLDESIRAAHAEPTMPSGQKPQSKNSAPRQPKPKDANPKPQPRPKEPAPQPKPSLPADIPAHLADLIDPEGLDLEDGQEDSLLVGDAHCPKRRRRRRRGRHPQNPQDPQALK